MKNDMVGRSLASSRRLSAHSSASRVLARVSGNLCLALAGVIALIVLSACDQQGTKQQASTKSADQETQTASAHRPGDRPAALQWRVIGGSEGASATLLSPDEKPVLIIGCNMSGGRLEVEVPGFTRIGSEDRLSLGFDDDPIALTVDMQWSGPGVRARGTAPSGIVERIMSADAVGVAYGQQMLGPYAPPGASDRQSLAAACSPLVPQR